ncbi:MAG: hypothetical protein IJ088_03285 [Clostridia bacterium]|nr:hypothetical protein [Clostridia bacterium]
MKPESAQDLTVICPFLLRRLPSVLALLFALSVLLLSAEHGHAAALVLIVLATFLCLYTLLFLLHLLQDRSDAFPFPEFPLLRQWPH